MEQQITDIIAEELNLDAGMIAKVENLLNEGWRIPYLARYRSQLLGGMDEETLRLVRDRLWDMKILVERKSEMIAQLEKSGELTDELRKKIEQCADQQSLNMVLEKGDESSRQTRGAIARKLGLEPLALRMFEQGDDDELVEDILQSYMKDCSVEDPEEALAGAKSLVAEIIGQNPDIRAQIRDLTRREGIVVVAQSKRSTGKIEKYRPFYHFKESLQSISVASLLLILEGVQEKELTLKIDVDPHEVYPILDDEVIRNPKSIWKRSLLDAIREAYEHVLAPWVERELRFSLNIGAEAQLLTALKNKLVQVFEEPPFGAKPVAALAVLDTVAALAGVDAAGTLLESRSSAFEELATEEALQEFLAPVLDGAKPEALAIASFKALKSTKKRIRKILRSRDLGHLPIVVVNLPDLSLLLGTEKVQTELEGKTRQEMAAVLTARHFQDPLLAMARRESTALTMGFILKDIPPVRVDDARREAFETIISRYGLDLNVAPVELLAFVPGLDADAAEKIAAYRAENGPFATRAQLVENGLLSASAFEQASGFLRLESGNLPTVLGYPEDRADVLAKIEAQLPKTLVETVGNAQALAALDAAALVTENLGEKDITALLADLKRADRKGRPSFVASDASDEIESIDDLSLGMILKGKVKTFTQYGVFVNLGIGQDGMIHVSELDHDYVDDPTKVLAEGDEVSVKVIQLDLERRRIGLSRRQLMEKPAAKDGDAPRSARRDGDSGGRSKKPGRNQSGPRGRRDGKDRKPRDRMPKEQQPKKDVIAAGRLGDALMAALKKNQD